MKLKITSIFLLLLFCIVIAFPGYGSNNTAQKKQTIVYADECATSITSLLVMIKKCLAKGVNMIEEERNTEEEDASHSAGLTFFKNTHNLFFHTHFTQTISFTSYQQSRYTSVCFIIFSPPDCIISC